MIRSLLAGAIDYAGLFPPAGLAMGDAVRNFARYRDGDDAWALGRFVVQAARLEELAAAAHGLRMTGTPDEPWRVSALLGDDAGAGVAAVRDFNARHGMPRGGAWAARVDTLEARAGDADAVEALARIGEPGLQTFVEVAGREDPTPVLTALAVHRMPAKIRTGGVTAAQFPSPAHVATFIAEAARLRVPFKATAGLHHPIRAEYALTYEPGSERGTMYGFLNVFLAAAAAQAGAPPAELMELLDERDPGAFHVAADRITWRQRTFTAADVADLRSGAALSFGSCSFEEPLADLRTLGLLPGEPLETPLPEP